MSTAKTLWLPAINKHGGFGRWAFVEITDPWDAEKHILKAIDEILNEDKISPSIIKHGVPEWAKNNDGTVNLTIMFFKDISLDDAEDLIYNVRFEPTLDYWEFDPSPAKAICLAALKAKGGT